MNTPLDHLSVPSMENLYLLLDKHGDQLREMQLAVDAASTTPPEFKKNIQWLILSTVLYLKTTEFSLI